MELTVFIPIFFVAAYLLGSIPFGYLLGKFKGIDIREHGSKNIGATNVMRVLGKGFGVAALLLDMLKGFIPAFVLAGLVAGWEQSGRQLAGIVFGAGAILGHVFPCFLRFRGGKAVATGCGVFLALDPLATVGAFAVWGSVVMTARYVSVGSMAGAAALPVFLLLLHNTKLSPYLPSVAFGVAVAVLVVVRHRANLRRLRAGTEPRLGESEEDRQTRLKAAERRGRGAGRRRAPARARLQPRPRAKPRRRPAPARVQMFHQVRRRARRWMLSATGRLARVGSRSIGLFRARGRR